MSLEKEESVIRYENNTNDLQGLSNQIVKIKEFAGSGAWKSITPERFQKLYNEDPDFVTTYILEALGVRMSILYRGLRNAIPNEPAEQGIKTELAYIHLKFSETKFTEREGQNAFTMDLFWMAHEEREGIKALIELGADGPINEFNFPGLEGLDEKLISELKANAIQSRIDRLSNLLIRRNKFISEFGYKLSGNDGEKDPVSKDLKNRIVELFEVQSSLLSGE